jgi:hypothetical protein
MIAKPLTGEFSRANPCPPPLVALSFRAGEWVMGCRFGAYIGIALASVGSIATAADIKPSTLKDGRVVIAISGEVSPGDTDALKAAIKVANDAGKLVTSIRLNSEGGNLLEGVRLAEAVKFAKMTTNVGQGATCASACFLIFAAGENKYANYSARIGVHGASDKGEETVRSTAATVSMARVAKDLGVPSSIIGRMVVTPPSEMVWLSPSDLQSMGTTMVGKPAQVAAGSESSMPRQIAPQTPTDLSPPSSTKASAPPTWETALKGAIKLSAEQNNGKPLTVRGCQPEFKTCFNAVAYTNSEGVETMLKVVRNMDDKIIAREACTFNASKDIRKCLDWDTERFRRDMKDINGNWSKIADE